MFTEHTLCIGFYTLQKKCPQTHQFLYVLSHPICYDGGGDDDDDDDENTFITHIGTYKGCNTQKAGNRRPLLALGLCPYEYKLRVTYF